MSNHNKTIYYLILTYKNRNNQVVHSAKAYFQTVFQYVMTSLILLMALKTSNLALNRSDFPNKKKLRKSNSSFIMMSSPIITLWRKSKKSKKKIPFLGWNKMKKANQSVPRRLKKISHDSLMIQSNLNPHRNWSSIFLLANIYLVIPYYTNSLI